MWVIYVASDRATYPSTFTISYGMSFCNLGPTATCHILVHPHGCTSVIRGTDRSVEWCDTYASGVNVGHLCWVGRQLFSTPSMVVSHQGLGGFPIFFHDVVQSKKSHIHGGLPLHIVQGMITFMLVDDVKCIINHLI
jgi:hypothetical protein